MTSRPRNRKRVERKHYSKGELNRLIDDIIHPLANQRPELMLLDTVLHAFVEQNPPETAAKFVRYSLLKVIKAFFGKS